MEMWQEVLVRRYRRGEFADVERLAARRTRMRWLVLIRICSSDWARHDQPALRRAPSLTVQFLGTWMVLRPGCTVIWDVLGVDVAVAV